MFRARGDPYEQLLAGMLPYHNSFRSRHAILMQRLPETSTMTKSQLLNFLQIGAELTHHLEMHHSIEEQYIFPQLAKRLPQFGDAHIKEHARMHEAVEALGTYISQCTKKIQNSKTAKKKKDESASADAEEKETWPKDVFDEEKMKGFLVHLHDTLFVHLEHEEASLRADSLKAAGFTEAELRRIPL